jgi:hypothetical protein
MPEPGVDLGHAFDLPSRFAGGHFVGLDPALVNALAQGQLALGTVN